MVATILIDFMYATCLGQQCRREVEPLKERIYLSEDGVLLESAMREEYRKMVQDKVNRERVKLLQDGVPADRLGILCCNDNPIDGVGCVIHDTEDILTAFHQNDIAVRFPMPFFYACVDVDDKLFIRQYVHDYAIDLL